MAGPPAKIFGDIFFSWMAHKRDLQRIDIERESARESQRLATETQRREYGYDQPDYARPSIAAGIRGDIGGAAQNLPESAYPTRHVPGLRERTLGVSESAEERAQREEQAKPIGEQLFTEDNLGDIDSAMSEMDVKGATTFSRLFSGMREGARTRAQRGINRGDLYLGMVKRFEEPDIKKKILSELDKMEGAAPNDFGKEQIKHIRTHTKAGTLADHFMPNVSAAYKQAETERKEKAGVAGKAEERRRKSTKVIRDNMAKLFGYSDYHAMEAAASVAVVQGTVRAIKYWEEGGMSEDEAMERALMEDPHMYGELVQKKYTEAEERPLGSGNWFVGEKRVKIRLK